MRCMKVLSLFYIPVLEQCRLFRLELETYSNGRAYRYYTKQRHLSRSEQLPHRFESPIGLATLLPKVFVSFPLQHRPEIALKNIDCLIIIFVNFIQPWYSTDFFIHLVFLSRNNNLTAVSFNSSQSIFVLWVAWAMALFVIKSNTHMVFISKR